jgi:hypothetical protein
MGHGHGHGAPSDAETIAVTFHEKDGSETTVRVRRSSRLEARVSATIDREPRSLRRRLSRLDFFFSRISDAGDAPFEAPPATLPRLSRRRRAVLSVERKKRKKLTACSTSENL